MDKWVVGVRTLRKSKIIIVFLSIYALVNGLTLEKPIDQVPAKDRERIAYFFKHAIFWDTYGYVLLGDKPCAITHYLRLTWNPLTWLEFFSPHNLKMKRGWAAWKKYERLFPHPQFLFLEDNSYLTAAHFIILVHRGTLLQMVRTHQKDFQSVPFPIDRQQSLEHQLSFLYHLI